MKTTNDTINDQKYNSLPYPNGRSESGCLWLVFIPHNKNNWLVASITEWIPSETMEELPVTAAAVNFEAAISISTAKETYKNNLDFIDLVILTEQLFSNIYFITGLSVIS
jgi:hypothetical protein